MTSKNLQRHQAWALGLLLLVLGGLLGSAVRDVWSIDPDAAAYMGLARSLAGGDGYMLEGLPHAKYPPGLPLALWAVSGLVGPDGYAGFHLLLVGALLAAVLGSWLLARRLGYPAPVALALATCVGCSATLFDLSVHYLRTEVLFLALSLATLLLLEKALAPGGRATRLALGALLLAASLATRLAGVTLLALPAARLLAPGRGSGADGTCGASGTRAGIRRRAALLLGLGLFLLFSWVLRGQRIRASHPQAPDYGAELLAAAPRDLTKTVPVDLPRLDAAGLVDRVATNLTVFSRACGVLLTNLERAGPWLPLGAALAVLVLLGLFRWLGEAPPDRAPAAATFRRDSALYVLSSLGLYLIWPFNQQERFYAPLLPLLLLAAGEGALPIWRLAMRFTQARAGRVVLLLAVAGLCLAVAARRSEHPAVLGRWSHAAAALIVALLLLLLLLLWIFRRGALPAPRPWLVLLPPLLFATVWLSGRFSEWPRRLDAFAAWRAAHPVPADLARIDVNPLLEQLALFLRDHTSDDAVLMTDVPKLMAVLSRRRCVPFRYRRTPPKVLPEGADYIFYTGEIPELAAIMDRVAGQYAVALRLPPAFDGERKVLPVLYAMPGRDDG